MTMPITITFRVATFADAALLLAWRNDADTRANSLHADLIDADAHAEWLRASLASPDRALWIALRGGAPVGTVRLDRCAADVWELSWTVAPAARGTGVGKAMVAAAARRAARPLVARIRAQAIASQRVAAAAGFTLERTEDGVQWWRLL